MDSSAYFWLILVLVIVLVFAGVVAWLRRRLSPHEDFHGEGFTLVDLRRLHQDGTLSDDEFERAEAGMIAAAQAAERRRQEERQNIKEWGWDTKGRP